MNKGIVYGLVDPRKPESIRYIGVTTQPKARLYRHIHDFKYESTHKSNWIKSLLRDGIKPEMLILEECSYDKLYEREIQVIQEYKKSHNLTNSNGGGLGGTSPTEEVKEKMRRSNTNKCRNLTDQQVIEIYKIYNQNNTRKEVAKILNLKLGAVKNTLDKKNTYVDTKLKYNLIKRERNKELLLRNLPIPKRTLTEEQVSLIFKLYKEGIKYKKISEILNISKYIPRNIIINKNTYKDIRHKYE